MKLTERQRSVLIALGFAVAAAVIIILAVKKSGSSGPSTPKASGGDVVVFVAARDIPANTPGSELAGSVETQRVARSSVVAGAISQLAQVEGRTSTSTIYKGEQINLQRFQPVQAEGVTGQLTGTYRAYQLPGDTNQLLVGTLKAGDQVDVIANVKFKQSNFRDAPAGNATSPNQSLTLDQTATRIILRNIPVLADPAKPTGGGFGGSGGYSVLLKVTDNQAQKLFFAEKNADYTLELRPGHGATDDPSSVETNGSILADGLQRPQYLQLLLGVQGPQ